MGKYTTTSLAFIRALEAGNLEQAVTYLHPQFQMQGWTSIPLDLAGFRDVFGSLLTAFTRVSFHFNGWVEDQPYVKGIIQLTTQQQASFRLPDTQLIAFTGRSVSLPREAIIFEFRQNQIFRWLVQQVTDGGIAGLIAQVEGEKVVVQ